MENTIDNKRVMLGFADSGKYWERLIPSSRESDNYNGKGYVSWGDDNLYPFYLKGLYDEVAILHGIVDNVADYASGEDIICNVPGFDKRVNPKGETMYELVNKIAKDYLKYGAFTVQVVRNALGDVAALYHLPLENLRFNKDVTVAYYSEEYDKKYARSNKTLRYPVWSDISRDDVSIYYSGGDCLNVYPNPVYGSAVRACEIQRCIDKFHLSGIKNGFSASYIINFNNGQPTDEQKEEIERNVLEKFCGENQAGSLLLSFSDSKDNAITLNRIDSVDFGEKYKAASERSRDEIFASFRCSPLLVGMSSIANTGFSTTEFNDSFRLFNKTVVKPVQKKIGMAFNRIFGMENTLTIKPFSLEDNNIEITE